MALYCVTNYYELHWGVRVGAPFVLQGCYEKIKDWIADNAVLLICVGVAIALVQVKNGLKSYFVEVEHTTESFW